MKTIKATKNEFGDLTCDACKITMEKHSKYCCYCGCKLIVEEENKGYWEPEAGERFFFINLIGEVEETKNERSVGFITNRYGNCFRTREEAEKELERRKAIVRVKKFIAKNNLFFEPDWDNLGYSKIDIYFKYGDKKFGTNSFSTVRCYSPISYFESEEDARKVINNCEEDLKLIFDI